MKPRSRKLKVESLEGRSMLSTTAPADFNHDGLMDLAAITSPNTIEVRLANSDGSYTVSAILKAPKNQSLSDIGVNDYDGDGYQDDIYASSPGGGGWIYTSKWLGNDDGTFTYKSTDKWHWPPKGNYGSW